MKILITGASGLIGTALTPVLEARGHEVLRLVRRDPDPARGQVHWNPDQGAIDKQSLEGIEAAIHLAGKPLAEGRWTPERKKQYRHSRVAGTHLLAVTLATLEQKPRVLLSASAIGYYGDRGADQLREESPPGPDYLAQLCRDWEAAAQPAAEAGIRVARMRIGIVLSRHGGALAQMLPSFRLGLGAALGGGRQYMSWIAMPDVLGAMLHILDNDIIEGPVNLTAPAPVTNKEMTRTLGRVLGRPALLSAPAPVLRLAFGEMADAALLSSARVSPVALLDSGYRFRFPELEPALRHALGK